MLNMDIKLIKRQEEGKIIRTAVVGCGQQGSGIVAEMSYTPGITASIACDIKIENAKEAFKMGGIAEDDIYEAKTLSQANALIEKGKKVITDDFRLAAGAGLVDVVTESTGIPEVAASIILDAISNKKHIVTQSVEADTFVGPLLKRKADEAGVIYTLGAGDEPAACMELYSFARGMGMDIWVVGRGVLSIRNTGSNPDFCYDLAVSQKLSPRLLTTFQDGTKVRVEMASVCNATGLKPDCPDLHQPVVPREDLVKAFRLKEDGGILNKLGVVDCARGAGVYPGVFVIVSKNNEEIAYHYKYVLMGPGPSWLLYRPYHLCCLEVPLSVARCVIYNEPTMVPIEGGLTAEVMAVTKKNLKKGEYLDDLGGFTVYGSIDSYDSAKEKRYLPLGIVNEKTRLLQDVKKDEILTYDMVELDIASIAYKLRKEQDTIFDK